ncbi:MAG: VanZ family protein [Deltaproteobacteria bacterium]|nr:VanZ family protein [Deltaproteobacteria bacterium]
MDLSLREIASAGWPRNDICSVIARSFATKQSNLLKFLPALAYAILLFYLSSGVRTTPAQINDKILHIMAYGGLGFLVAYGIQGTSNFKALAIIFIAGLLSTLYGVGDEIHQYFVPGRFYSYGDMIADAIGSFLGAMAFLILLQWVKKFNGRHAISK